MRNVLPENVIVIDIETAPAFDTFDKMDVEWQDLWQEKVLRIVPEGMTAGEFYQHRAGVMAEFARIVCISIGYFKKESKLTMRVTSFYDTDEKKLLMDFTSMMDKIQSKSSNWSFAGHNIKEFDIPFICRRLLINRLPLPAYLDFQNMKPWETNLVDTFQFWRFGDFKQFTSLKLLAAAMGIPSPKDDIDGSMVGELYWSGNDEERNANLKRIVNYCQKDVITTGNVLLRLKNMDPVLLEDVQVIE